MPLFSNDIIEKLAGSTAVEPPKNYALPTQFPSWRKAYRVCIDFEAHDPEIKEKGPGWRRDAADVGISLALQEKSGEIVFAEYYPTGHRVGQNLQADKVWNYFADEAAFYTGEIVGANLLYDVDGLHAKGVFPHLAKFRDVQWAEALLNENAQNYKLNTLAKDYLNETKVTDELKVLYGNDYITRCRDIWPGHMKKYGVGDVTLPLRVLALQEKKLKQQNLLDLFDLESRLLPFLIYMKWQGVRVDLDKASKLGVQFTTGRDEALTKLTKLVNKRGFVIDSENFGKPTVLGQMFDHLGIKYNTNKNGLPTGFTDKWLENNAGEAGELLSTANAYDKANGTFVDGYISEYAIGDRVYPSFHPLRKVDNETEKANGTVTGRFSGTNPNLQNIPARDEEIGPLCRSMFIADAGAEWWSQDYSQIEYRFLIHYAVELQCKGALAPQKAFIGDPNTDFHELVAKLVWAADWNEVQRKLDAGEIDKTTAKKMWKKIRGPAKNLNFGLVYGMGKDKLARELGEVDEHGKPNATALKIMADYHAGAPFIKDLTKKCVAYAEKHKFIDTILGRRRRFDEWESSKWDPNAKREPPMPLAEAIAKWGEKNIRVADTHKALNSRLQGSAADLMKLAMVLIWESGVLDRGNDITCNLTVHDELNGSFVRSARGLVSLAEVKRIMETAMKLHVPVLTGGATGKDWSEAK